jgi:hypothetical protein
MARQAPRLNLSPYDLIDLRRLANAPSTPQALAFRARLVLRCAQPDNPRNDHVAQEFGCGPDTVAKWRGRFRRGGFTGLQDLPRSGRPATFSPGRPPQGGRAGHHQTRRRRHSHRTVVAR